MPAAMLNTCVFLAVDVVAVHVCGQVRMQA